ncbi:MAG: prolyl oligopeptidase family serine peptidase [Treponema sp.]|nr:prolyl oligopeptidase family serine peptidase [Treponema sp.]
MAGFLENVGNFLNTVSSITDAVSGKPSVEKRLSFSKQLIPQTREFVLYVGAYDWGAGTFAAVINTGMNLTPSLINKNDFQVSVVTISSTSLNSAIGLTKGPRKVDDAYLSDGYGRRTNESSSFITLCFPVGPDVEFSDPFCRNILNTVNDLFGLRIQNEKLNLNITKMSGAINPLAAEFNFNTLASNGISMQYAYWNPPQLNQMGPESGFNSDAYTSSNKVPLIVWLHGVTEGGANPFVPLFGIKSVNLITKQIQKYFPDGAAVLIPQCPTTWLETTSVDPMGFRIWEPIDIQGAIKKYAGPFLELLSKYTSIQNPIGTSPDGNPIGVLSYYTNALKNLIDYHISTNPNIDKNRIYLGGCSAGGYMTLNMLINFPGFFAAAFPTCEVYVDSKISDQQIKILAETPLWFVHSRSDKTAKPHVYDEATVARIKSVGAKDLHFSLYDDVRDLTGNYKDADGNPLIYDGHFSWIYVLNNAPSDQGITLFEWLSKQSLQK